MISFRPRSVDQQRLRYSTALVKIYDMLEVELHPSIAPGGKPEHVFDFEDGLTLIISRERTPHGQVVTHCSASSHSSTPVNLELAMRSEHESPRDAVVWFLRFAVERWRELGLFTHEPKFIGFSEGKGIPHWHLE